MRKILSFLVFFFLVSISSTHAASSVEKFSIEATPGTFKVGETVDFTVKALDGSDNVVADFDEGVFFIVETVNGSGVLPTDYSLPGDGGYVFVSEDGGQKTFSKGLKVTQPGVYVLSVQRMLDPTMNGEARITVLAADGSTPDAATVTIMSPVSDSLLTNTTVSVIGESSSPRTPLFITVDGKEVDGSFVTDETGSFAVSLTDVDAGKHVLSVALKNVDGTVLGVSSDVSFSVKAQDDKLLRGFNISPLTGLSINQEFTVTVDVSNRVSSMEILFNGQTEPLSRDKTDSTKYSGIYKYENPGVYDVKFRMYVNGESTDVNVEDDMVILEPDPVVTTGVIATGTVATGTIEYKIGAIKTDIVPLVSGSALLSWNTIGEVSPYYLIRYGIDQNNLNKRMLVTQTGAMLEGLALDKITYGQVRPSTATGGISGEPSDPFTINFHYAAPKCVVKGIKLRSEQRGSDYYLVWDPVIGVTNYTIYRSDTASSNIASMEAVGTTVSPEYRYPFDPNAEHEEYAYYAVQANCKGGINKPVGGMEKVKTGPMSSALLVLLVVVGLYLLYRVNTQNLD